MSISREHRVISQALPIVGFELGTSTSQTLKSEKMTTRPTTPNGTHILCISICSYDACDKDQREGLEIEGFGFPLSKHGLCS